MRYEPQIEPAQGQLAQLRADLDVRLAALEAALADPARSGSLAGLILDLARVATEEAKAAAATATLEAKREGEARARADVQAALDAERAANADVRRRAEGAAKRIAGLENKELELAATVAELESALERAREDAVRFERELGEALVAVETERASTSTLRRTAEHAATASESHARQNAGIIAEHKDLQAAHKKLQAAYDETLRLLSLERQTTADLRTGHAEVQASLEEERASALELRQVAARAADMSETLVREKAEVQAAHEALKSELARERGAAADLQRVVADTRARLETARASAADLGSAVERAEAQLETERAATAALRLAVDRAQEQQASAAAAQAEAQASHESLQREVAAARAEASRARAELDDARSRLHALESEGGVSAELRQTAESAEQKIAKLIDLQNQTVAKTAAARRDLTTAQAEASAARVELDKMKARVQQLESERAANAELRGAVERAEQKLASVTSVQVQTLTNYEKLEKELALARQEAAVLRSKLARLDGAAKSKLAAASEQEWEAIRLAARCVLREPIAVEVNGGAGSLVDLSVDGCQLLLTEAVKQKQVVKLMVPSEKGAIACSGKVAWARPEPGEPEDPPRFRAGVAFIKPDVPAIEAVMAAHID